MFNDKKGYGGYFHVLENHSVLGFHNGNKPLVIVEYNSHSNLPITLAKNDMMLVAAHATLVCILNDNNQNLTHGQKLLLLWHTKFTHKNFRDVQMLIHNLPFMSNQKDQSGSPKILRTPAHRSK